MTRYELLERIGAGATAEIYRGRMAGAFGFEKPVAVKKIRPELGQDPRYVRALVAEANLLARLRHRGVVHVFDVGVDEKGEHFLVMEYVDGEDLRAVLDSGIALPIDLAAHVGAELCDTLEEAHRAGVVHRAVTASSVLISAAGEVKLTDFGPARGDPTSTGADDVRAVGVLLRRMLPEEIPRDLDRIVRKAVDGEWKSAGELAAALRDFRYSASTSAGEPARELARLLKQVSRRAPRVETSVVVELHPVGGFDTAATEVEPPTTIASRKPAPRALHVILALLAFALGVLATALVLRH